MCWTFFHTPNQNAIESPNPLDAGFISTAAAVGLLVIDNVRNATDERYATCNAATDGLIVAFAVV